jgi:DNA-binding SARP family transcriptional activator
MFGPLSVSVDGHPVKITSPNERALFAALAMDAGRPVSLNKICRALWHKDYSENLEGALRPLITRARKTLGAARGLIATEPSAYQLMVSPDDVDILAFQSRYEAGRAAAAAGGWQQVLDLFREAAALWKDTPFAGIAAPYLRDEHAETLYAQRSILRVKHIEAEIRVLPPRAAGDVLHEIESLIRDNPDDEHLRWLRMLALYRSGRPSRALDAYSQTRGYLIDEHGREPDHELRNLQKLMLDDDPCLLKTPFRG